MSQNSVSSKPASNVAENVSAENSKKKRKRDSNSELTLAELLQAKSYQPQGPSEEETRSFLKRIMPELVKTLQNIAMPKITHYFFALKPEDEKFALALRDKLRSDRYNLNAIYRKDKHGISISWSKKRKKENPPPEKVSLVQQKDDWKI